jgi:predicted SnoaL-like aldol condensation-catalyzing enzyme
MNTDTNKTVVERYFELWNSANLAIADEILAPNYVDHAHLEVDGVESVKQSVVRVRETFPDFNITVDSILSEGDLVAVRGIVRRTQQAKPTVARVMWFVRVINNQMTDLWTGTETMS